MRNRNHPVSDGRSAISICGLAEEQDIEITVELLRLAQGLQAARDARAKFFAPYMFGEPAWNVLLALYIARGRGYQMKVTDLCFEAAAAPTTVIRWIDYLMEKGHVEKSSDDYDGRVTYVALTPSATHLLNRCLRHMMSIFAR